MVWETIARYFSVVSCRVVSCSRGVIVRAGVCRDGRVVDEARRSNVNGRQSPSVIGSLLSSNVAGLMKDGDLLLLGGFC